MPRSRTNRNGYPVLKALKPNDGDSCSCAISRRIRSKSTDDFNSERIELTILPVVLSSVTVEGSFEPFYFNDGSNTADVSALTVTALDEDGNDFDVTGKVKWYAEANDDITVDETTGSIEFTAPGTYQVYAVVNGTGIQPCTAAGSARTAARYADRERHRFPISSIMMIRRTPLT